MSTPTLTDLLNRLAVRVQPKRHMLEEFGTIVTEALAAKLISEDFYNYGITDLGMSKRNTLKAGHAGVVSVVAPHVPTPIQTTVASQEPAMNLHVKKLLDIIGRFENGASLTELEAETNTSTPTLRLRINELLKQNSITRIGEGLPGKPYRYCTPDQGTAHENVKEPEVKDAEPVEPEPVEPEPVEPAFTLEVDRRKQRVLERFGAITVNPVQEFQLPLLKLEQPAGMDPEITAMQTMLAALEPLDDMARSRAIGWVSSRLGLC